VREMPESAAGEALAVQRRQEEWTEHMKLVHLLAKNLDPSCTFLASLDNKPISALSALFQNLRGVRSGLADMLVVDRYDTGIMVIIDLKTRRELASKAPKQVCLEMLPSGAVWGMARSARSDNGCVALASCSLLLDAAAVWLLRAASSARPSSTVIGPRSSGTRLRTSKRFMRCKKVGVALPPAREN
jgi:hypothetical protein